MTTTLTPLAPAEAEKRLMQRRAVLVDIREPAEFARRHVRGAVSRPLSAFEPANLLVEPGRDVIFACRTGMRTCANCARLADAVQGPAFVLDGGVDAWTAAGLPVDEDRKAPLDMARQVQIVAGLLVLIGLGLGVWLDPSFFALSGFMGSGLVFAGATGLPGVTARLLAMAPWNRRAAD